MAEAGGKQIFATSPSHSEPNTLLLFQSCVSVLPADVPCPLAYQAARASPSWLATPLALLGLPLYKPKYTPPLTDSCPALPHPSCSKSDHETRPCHLILCPALLCPKIGSSWQLYYTVQNPAVIFLCVCVHWDQYKDSFINFLSAFPFSPSGNKSGTSERGFLLCRCMHTHRHVYT